MIRWKIVCLVDTHETSTLVLPSTNCWAFQHDNDRDITLLLFKCILRMLLFYWSGHVIFSSIHVVSIMYLYRFKKEQLCKEFIYMF